MKLKQSLLFILTISAALLSANSYAGRQGINYFYGIGIGAVAPKDADVTATGSVFLGLIEDGFAIEAAAFTGSEGGTDFTGSDYSVSGTDVGISFRSIEKNGRYNKFKASNTTIDYKDIDTVFNTSDTFEVNGRSYTIGMGWRTSRENRVEVDYTYHDNDDFNEVIHFISVSYLWGGAPYLGGQF